MVAPRKYPDELRERATRLVVEARKGPAARVGAVKRIADQLGVHPEALRTWVTGAEQDEGLRPGPTTAEQTRIAELERENRELRRANQILKSAALDSTGQRNSAGGVSVCGEGWAAGDVGCDEGRFVAAVAGR